MTTTRRVQRQPRPRSAPRSAVRRTAIAIVLLALLLFPVYWMLNISLQPSGNALSGTFFPTHPSLAGYRSAIADQGGHLVISLLIAAGTVVVTLLIAAPCAYALAQFRFRWISWALLAILISQMIPGIVIANALYTAYERLGLLDSIPGLIIAELGQRDPVRDPDHALVHARRPAVDRRGGPGRRGRAGPRVPVDRGADQPQLADHRRAVRVPVRLERLPLRAHPDHQGPGRAR